MLHNLSKKNIKKKSIFAKNNIMKRGIITFGVLTLLFLNSTWGQLASRIRTYTETTVSDVHISVYKSPFRHPGHYVHAYFSDRDHFHVTAMPDYPVRGQVNGSRTYFEGDTVTLTAIPNNTYRFLHWDDGDTSNPRQFIITQDSSFTAHFDWQTEGISSTDNQNALFTLTPNPAHHSVTVTIDSHISILKSQ